jgi:two-component system phosphate regulon response regulator PhoB
MDVGRSNRPMTAMADGEERSGSVSTHAPGAKRPLVLVIEDDPSDWEIYGKILWYNGYDVFYAGDGDEGYRLAKEHRPDLILLDLMLPRVDGLSLCRRMKDDTEVRDVPIVVLSGRPVNEFGPIALELGCRDYLEKPISPVEVLHRVERLIGRAPPSGVGRAPEMYPPDA